MNSIFQVNYYYLVLSKKAIKLEINELFFHVKSSIMTSLKSTSEASTGSIFENLGFLNNSMI